MGWLLTPFLVAQLVVGAPAQVEIHYMPPGTSLKLQGGQRVKYYTFDEYKLLLTLDGDLWTANQQLETLGELKLSWNNLLEQKDKVITTLQTDVTTFQGRAVRLQGKWDTCEDSLVKASGGSIWPWVIAGTGVVVGIVGVAFGLGYGLSK